MKIWPSFLQPLKETREKMSKTKRITFTYNSKVENATTEAK